MNATLTSDDLRKAASALQSLNDRNQVLEKRAQAEAIYFDQVEQGMVPSPRSLQDFETKLAALMTRDLKVVAEAMKLATGAAGFGTIEEGPSLPETDNAAHKNFQQALMEV